MNKKIFAIALLLVCCIEGMQKNIETCELELSEEKKKEKKNFFEKLGNSRLELLGDGHFGLVYKAQIGENPSKFGALKMISTERLESKEKALWSEICINNLFVGNPYIVQMYDWMIEYPEKKKGQIASVKANILLELGDRSLDKELAEPSGRIDTQEKVIKVFLDVLAGLEHIHAKGIVHKDIYARNIILFKDIAKIGDFGISGFSTEGKAKYINQKTQKFEPSAFGMGWMTVVDQSQYVDVKCAGFLLYHMMFKHDLIFKAPNYNYDLPAGTDWNVAKIIMKTLTMREEDQAQIAELKALGQSALTQKVFKSLKKPVTVNIEEALPDFEKLEWVEENAFTPIEILRKAIQGNEKMNNFKLNLNLPLRLKKKIMRRLSNTDQQIDSIAKFENLKVPQEISEISAAKTINLDENRQANQDIVSNKGGNKGSFLDFDLLDIGAICFAAVYLILLAFDALKCWKQRINKPREDVLVKQDLTLAA